MPRMNLTDEEAATIERLRIKNTAAIANNLAIDRCISIVKQYANTTGEADEILSAMEHLKEPIRP